MVVGAFLALFLREQLREEEGRFITSNEEIKRRKNE
jgi:hypothetical protein